MARNKTLLLVQDLELVSTLNHEDITFLFPVQDFAVGFPTYFDVFTLPEGSFIYLNRLLDNEDIKKVRDFLNHLPSTIKGIVFDDIGILNILKNSDLTLTKILFLNHFNCNHKSVNAYLKYVDSLVLSTDLTFQETKNILALANKPLVLYTFGHVNIMYSRRTLISNYNQHFNKNVNLTNELTELNSKQKFKIIENPHGTIIYTEKPFNALLYREFPNVLYNLINTVFLTKEQILTIINAKDNLEEMFPYKYLGLEETLVKIKEAKK